MQKLPLTVNGKVNKKALPNPKKDTLSSGVAYVAPEREIEKQLTSLWEKLLQRVNIGLKDDFFMIGGNSINLVRLSGLYRREFNKKIPVQMLFENPVLEQHAQLLEEHLSTVEEEFVPLNTSNPKNRNMIFIPPIMGHAIIFRDFAKYIEGEFNCYGLNYDGDRSYNSLEEISDHFSQLITHKGFDKNETLFVLGYSMGAAIAYEVVKNLEKLNFTCELVLVDRYPNEEIFIDSIDQYSEEVVAQYLNETILGLYQDVSEEESIRLKQILLKNTKILEDYRISGVISANITGIVTTKNSGGDYMSPWKKYSKGEFQLYTLETTHYEIFKKPFFDSIYRSITVSETMSLSGQ
uniref:thioesterase domain-containing protein n=1 Tax=Fulvivirga marina TaxID=2494733 RepID=UPI003742A137